jgi:hypothetical protein
MTSSSPKIKKLKDINWLVWRTCMAAVLKRKKAYEVALGITSQLSDPSTLAIWKEKDAIAQEVITTVIHNEQIIHILTCNTAAEMWNNLRIIHEPQGQQSIISTKCALYSTQAKEGTNITAHLNKIKQRCEHFTLAGHLIEQDEFKAILVASHPRSWEDWTTLYLSYQGGTQGNQTTQTMTEQQLVSLLSKEETRTRRRALQVSMSTASSPQPLPIIGTCVPVTSVAVSITTQVIADSKASPNVKHVASLGTRAQNIGRNLPAEEQAGSCIETKRERERKAASKGQEHVHITKDDSESDTDGLDRTFTAYVSIVDENEATFCVTCGSLILVQQHTLAHTFHPLLCLWHNHASFYGTVLILVFI